MFTSSLSVFALNTTWSIYKIAFTEKGNEHYSSWKLDESDSIIFFYTSDQYQNIKLVIIGLFSNWVTLIFQINIKTG